MVSPVEESWGRSRKRPRLTTQQRQRNPPLLVPSGVVSLQPSEGRHLQPLLTPYDEVGQNLRVLGEGGSRHGRCVLADVARKLAVYVQTVMVIFMRHGPAFGEVGEAVPPRFASLA